MPLFCAYRDALGRPGQGVHAPRLGPYAAVDLGLTAAAAYALAGPEPTVGRFAAAAAALLVLAVVFHWAFCVDTALARQLGLAPPPAAPAAAISGGLKAGPREPPTTRPQQ